MTVRWFTVSFLLALFFIPVVFAHPEDGDGLFEKSGGTESHHAGVDIVDGIQRCLSSEEGKGLCLASLCDGYPGYVCAEDILGTMTVTVGAEKAMVALHAMTWEDGFSFDPSSAHLLAHTIGRTVAQEFGITGDSFVTCPTSFDYGCQHGFLEAGLTKIDSAVELITQMCESMPATPLYAKVACYHGSGHALTMNDSYDIHTSLSQCDMLPSEYRAGCWSGVFMENVNAILAGRIVVEEHNSFSDDNLFAPCDSVDEKYRDICYKQQMPYWVSYHHIDLQGLLEMCAMMERDYRGACVYSVGAYSIYPDFQDALLGADFNGTFIDKTIYICNQFPVEYREICYEPAIDQNFIYYDAGVISEFCEKIDEKYRVQCWWVVGRRIDGIVSDVSEKSGMCAPVPEMYRDICLNPYDRVDSSVPNQHNEVVLGEGWGQVLIEKVIDSTLSFLKRSWYLSAFF